MDADRASDEAAGSSRSRSKSGSSWISSFRKKRSEGKRDSNDKDKSPSREGSGSFKNRDLVTDAKESDNSESLYSDLEDDASVEVTDDEEEQETILRTLEYESWGGPPRMHKQPSIPTIEWHPESTSEPSSPDDSDHIRHPISNKELTSGNMPLRRGDLSPFRTPQTSKSKKAQDRVKARSSLASFLAPNRSTSEGQGRRLSISERRRSDDGSCASVRSRGSVRSSKSADGFRKRGFSKSAAKFVERHSLGHSSSNPESFEPLQNSSTSKRRGSDDGSCASARSQWSRGSVRSSKSADGYRKRGFSKSAVEFVERHSPAGRRKSLSTSDSFVPLKNRPGRRHSLSSSDCFTSGKYKNGLMAERRSGAPRRFSLSNYLETSETTSRNATECLESPEVQNRKEKGYISSFLGPKDDSDSPENNRTGSLLSRGLNVLENIYDNSLGVNK